MNTLLRNFFYGVGIVILCAMYGMNPATAQFGDVVRLMHNEMFWQVVATVSGVLVAADFIFAPRLRSQHGDKQYAASAMSMTSAHRSDMSPELGKQK